ncbi:MAG: ATP-dependent DNA ligase [Verrucomicrobiales bacterium]
MPLELTPPLPPMEAESVASIPEGRSWHYEPKWDGFRCLLFRDGADVQLQSKAGQPLARYFPEIAEAARDLKPRQFVLDGELVLPLKGVFSFDALLQRVHPAESRVRKLAAETPAHFVAFDLLADAKGKSLIDSPLSKRRLLLQKFASEFFPRRGRFHLSPVTNDLTEAKRWLTSSGGNLDGVIAKQIDLPYLSGERAGMQKVKRLRPADCVVGGFRYAEKVKVVGSLLLGLYDDAGLLHHVGFCSSIKSADKPKLTRKLEALIRAPGFTGNAPGGPSRWSTKRSTEWQPLKPKLVVEVSFDHVSGQRFRHGTRLVRWRPDKAPSQCTMNQLRQSAAKAFSLLP